MAWKATKSNRMTKRVNQEVVTPVVKFDHSHVYRFDLLSEWANTIRVIREKLALHRNSQLLSDIVVHILDIICKNGEGNDDIVLHFNMRDVYLLGFTLGVDVYEFGLPRAEAVQRLPASRLLGYGSGYGDMDAGNLTSINIGYPSFTNALIEMINGTRFEGHSRRIWMNDIRTRIPTVLVMLPECVRFKWHYLAVSQLITEGDTIRVHDWMGLGIRKWQRASEVAFLKERTDRTKLPPSGEIHEYDLNDMKIALEDWVWATDLLAVHCLLKPREPLHVLCHASVRNGDKDVPHLFVLWNNKEVDWQTESYMKRNFPYFDTRDDTFPTPPQPPA